MNPDENVEVPADEPTAPAPSPEPELEPAAPVPETTPAVNEDGNVVSANDAPGSAVSLPEVGEQLGTPSPDSPPVAVGTAAPAQDAVSLNNNLEKVAGTLREAREFIRITLQSHPMVEELIGDVDKLLDKVASAIS